MADVNLTTYSDADFSYTQAAPFDIGSNPLHMQVRTTAGDETVWLELTTDNEMITVDTVANPDNITLNILQPKLQNLPAGVYVYSLIMSSLGGTRRTEVFRGTLTHNIGPTRWDAGTP